MAARRGRPPKQRFEYAGSVFDPLEPDAVAALVLSVGELPCVRLIDEVQRQRLFSEIPSAVEYFRGIARMDGLYTGKGRGNKPKPDVSVLIFRVAELWKLSTGNERSAWEDGEGLESPVFQLARCCLEFVTGKPYPQSLRTQARRALAWERLP